MKKGIILVLIILVKVVFWFLFQLEIIKIALVVCEYLQLVPKGKQDLFAGLPKMVKVTNASFLIVEILLDIIIYLTLKFAFKNFAHNRLIINFLIVTFFVVSLFVIFTW